MGRYAFKLPDMGELHIPETELEISVARSGGPGGQNVNKRDTAVRMTHVPSGISVHVTSERSQVQIARRRSRLSRIS